MQSTSTAEPSHRASGAAIRAESVELRWDATLPVFAKEEFLRAVGDEYGWLGGIDASGTMRCVLPYTIVRKAGLRMVRFRVETIPCKAEFGLHEEQSFLNNVVQHFRQARADVIIPASTNTYSVHIPKERPRPRTPHTSSNWLGPKPRCGGP